MKMEMCLHVPSGSSKFSQNFWPLLDWKIFSHVCIYGLKIALFDYESSESFSLEVRWAIHRAFYSTLIREKSIVPVRSLLFKLLKVILSWHIESYVSAYILLCLFVNTKVLDTASIKVHLKFWIKAVSKNFIWKSRTYSPTLVY